MKEKLVNVDLILYTPFFHSNFHSVFILNFVLNSKHYAFYVLKIEVFEAMPCSSRDTFWFGGSALLRRLQSCALRSISALISNLYSSPVLPLVSSSPLKPLPVGVDPASLGSTEQRPIIKRREARDFLFTVLLLLCVFMFGINLLVVALFWIHGAEVFMHLSESMPP